LSGADEPASVSLSLDATDLATLPQLLSQGVAVTYAVNGAGDTLTASAGGREVFTLKVNADGSWAFDLKDQLDHVAGNGENTAARTVGAGSVGTIDLSGMIVVTDADGDSVRNLLTAGDFSITVQDDIPVRTNVLGATVTATVEEDDMTGVAGCDFQIGTNEDASVNKNEASGTTVSLTNLFLSGADEPAKVSLSLDAVDIGVLPKLLSNGVAVTYAVTDTNADTLADTLTASAGGREVFTLKVNADGSWAFDLKDQLDHVAGNGENTALRTVGGGSVDTIDFSEMIVVTDADGDSVRNLLTAGDFSITVQDDIPVRTNALGATVTATVEEDDM